MLNAFDFDHVLADGELDYLNNWINEHEKCKDRFLSGHFTHDQMVTAVEDVLKDMPSRKKRNAD